jgi:hypothetical protein
MMRFLWRGSSTVGSGFYGRFEAASRVPVVARTTSSNDIDSLKCEIEKRLARRTKVAIPSHEIDAHLLVRTGVCTPACDIEPGGGRLDDVYVFSRPDGDIEVLGRGVSEDAAYVSLALCIELLFGKQGHHLSSRENWLD